MAQYSSREGNKFGSRYWRSRVYRREYAAGDGDRRQTSGWWARIQHGGRRVPVALATNGREEAARRAARLYQLVKAAGWEVALKEFAPGKGEAKEEQVPTVGEFLAAVAAVADIAPRTLAIYSSSFRLLVAECFRMKRDNRRYDYVNGGRERWLAKISRIRLDRVTPEGIQAALNARIQAAKGDAVEEQRARTTAASTLRQARNLFSPRRKLPFVNLPNPFDGVRVNAGGIRPYASTIDAAALLRAGKVELAHVDDESYKAFLLALGAGLRKSEIDGLQWQQVDASRSLIRVTTTASFSPKTHASEGEVYVDPGLIAELEACRSPDSDLFVLKGTRRPRSNAPYQVYRADSTFKRLTKWLRGKGVLGLKPVHQLRKEFGSVVNAASDIHTASRQLRHASVAITSAYYADHRRRVFPAVGEMLNTKSAIKAK